MNANSPIVHVVDDDAAWRTSLERLLLAGGYRVALYESAEDFLAASHVEAPGCILLDVRMPGLTGLQLQMRLAEVRQVLPIVFLSGHADIPIAIQAMKAGAQDLLTKPVDKDVLFRAIEEALVRDRESRGAHDRLEALRSRLNGLTRSERQVFDHVVRGRLNKQIAGDLGITERTVKWHRHNLMEKLQVRSVAALVSLAEQLDMLGGRDRS